MLKQNDVAMHRLYEGLFDCVETFFQDFGNENGIDIEYPDESLNPVWQAYKKILESAE